jgi:heat shock protein HslJ
MWRALVVGVCLLAAVSCGSRAGSGGVTDLRGKTFLSTGVSENGQPKQLVAGTQIRLGFSEDGTRASAYAGCNHIGGAARIENGRLVVGDLAMTMMGCDGGRNEQDDWIAKLLADGPSVRLSGSELTLSRGTTEIRLLDRKVADPDRPLLGTRWVVDTVINGAVAGSTPQGAEATIVINADGAFRGNSGCNQMGGNAAVTATTITFSNVFTTKMACEPDGMRLEQAVLSVLRDAVTYRIDADALHLSHPSGAGLVLRAR